LAQRESWTGYQKHKEQAKMTRKPGGKTNAQKHGAFAQELILPGESEREFRELSESLIAEWSPNGVLEEDAVFNLAKYMWAKRRNDRFYHKEVSWIEGSKRDDLEWMGIIARFLGTAQTLEHANGLVAYLPEKCKDYVSSYSGSYSNMLPAGNDAGHEIKRLTQRVQECIEMERDCLSQPSRSSNVKTAAARRELTEKKIALDARLDSLIDKMIKRLVQMKTYKQVTEMQSAATTHIADDRSAPRLVSPETKDRAA
jgi:hypothetical protein